MDLSDPIVNQASQGTKTPTPDEKPVPHDEKTEEAIQRLEGEIDLAYTAIEGKFLELWSNASKNAHDIQEKIKFDEKKAALMSQLSTARENINNNKIVKDNVQSVETQLKELGEQVKGLEKKINLEKISTQVDSALDTLDSGLEYVEKQAGKYVSQFSSFFSSIVSVESAEPPAAVEAKEPETIFTNPKYPGGNYGSTRFDSELFKLHTTESLYLENAQDEKSEKFDAEAKTNEISDLLKKYPDTLERLMNKLVPVEISYETFWGRYFKLEDELKESEQKRKELLAKKESTNPADEEEDDEEFTWDDEEDEDDDVVKVERVQSDKQ